MKGINILKSKALVIWGIIFLVIGIITNVNVHASGGEEMEGSQLEQFLMKENAKDGNIVESLEDMGYALFLETNTGYGVSKNYYRYGIYTDFTKTEQEGEDIYFVLNEQLFGKPLKLVTYDKNANNVEGLPLEWMIHEKWAENEEEIIVDVSTDLEWMITREYEINCSGIYIERWYHGKELVREFEGGISSDIKQFEQHKTEIGKYEPISKENMQDVEELLKNFYGQSFSEYYNKWICFDTNGKLLAAVETDKNRCGMGINIYGIEDNGVELLHRINDLEFKEKWPMEISQIEGNEESGWLVFSYGDETYRMTYPSGVTEKIGEFMYDTVYSPDGRYLAYCTGNNFLFDYWEILDTPLFWKLRERWAKVLPGWYVEEIETGNKSYIPMPIWEYDVDRPLYGGRCVWIEKNKVQKYLGNQ